MLGFSKTSNTKPSVPRASVWVGVHSKAFQSKSINLPLGISWFPLLHCFVDDFRVIGPAHPIVARVGEDALLTCQLLPKRTAMHMEVRWYRSAPGAHVLLAHQDGAEVTEMQLEEHRGRVEWIEDNIAQGGVALKMYNVQPSDNGQYWCRCQEGNYYGETSLLLKVAGEYLGKRHRVLEGEVY